MKIRISYDLMEKISEANKGFSLTRISRKVLNSTMITGNINVLQNMAQGFISPTLLILYPLHVAFHSAYYAFFAYCYKDKTIENAVEDLNNLIPQLHTIHIRTDYESLLQSSVYETNYKLIKNGKLPVLEQKKYIMVPVRDDYFGDKELSIVQEHVIGTREYALSYGEPDKKKVYSLRARQPI